MLIVSRTHTYNSPIYLSGKIVCLFGLFMPHTNFARTLLCAMPAEHSYPVCDFTAALISLTIDDPINSLMSLFV